MLVRRYSHIEKNGSLFHPLRAAGLAVELAHKLARDVGFGAIDQKKLCSISISGPSVRVYESSRWRKVGPKTTVTLKVLPAEAELSYKVFREQRTWLGDMGLNVWHVDPPVAKKGVTSPDLIVDVGATSPLEVAGLVHVELKLFSATGIEQKIADEKTAFTKNFGRLAGIFEGIAAGLLLVSVVEESGDTWKPLTLRSFLWDNGTWQELSHPRGLGAHRHRMANKKPLTEVWDDMTWYENPRGGDDIGMVAHFLESLGLNKNNVAERVSAWKSAFPQRGPRKLDLHHVSIRRGWDKCWVGTQAAFRQVYHRL